MFWYPEELQELQASAVVDKIGKASAEESWKSSIIPVMLQHPDLFPLSGVTTDEDKIAALIKLAHMAGSLLMAYAFDIDRDDAKSENGDEASEEHDWEEDDEAEPLKGMVPLADMLNADADRNNVCAPRSSFFPLFWGISPNRFFSPLGTTLSRSWLSHYEGHKTHLTR